MADSNSFLKTVHKHFVEHLSEHGFKKRKEGIFTLEQDKETLGWVGLNVIRARGQGIIEINPVIGVRNQRLEKEVAELSYEKSSKYTPPSRTKSIGYLMPENTYTTWKFEAGMDPSTGIQELCELISGYTKDFVRVNANLELLLHNMISSGHGVHPKLMYRIPTAHYLMGNVERAEHYLQTELASLGERTDVAANLYRDFAQNLRNKMHIT